ncbi:MAG: lysoplasmalogenase family protein [Promethearchaeota archaeon]
MSTKFKGWYLLRVIYLIVLLIVMSTYLVFRGLFVVLGIGDLFLLQRGFLSVSILLSIFALINYLIARRYDPAQWKRYTLWLLIAMILGTLGDFLLADVLPVLIDTFIIGVLAFALGQVFYLVALRQLSPLLINPSSAATESGRTSSRLNLRNLIIWLGFIIVCVALFMLFLFNPALLELSIGGLIYFLLFASVLAFAITKFFDNYPLLFKASLVLGFALFYISDVILVWNRFNFPLFFASLFISITYLLGQFFVQLTPLLKSDSQ